MPAVPASLVIVASSVSDFRRLAGRQWPTPHWSCRQLRDLIPTLADLSDSPFGAITATGFAQAATTNTSTAVNSVSSYISVELFPISRTTIMPVTQDRKTFGFESLESRFLLAANSLLNITYSSILKPKVTQTIIGNHSPVGGSITTNNNGPGGTAITGGNLNNNGKTNTLGNVTMSGTGTITVGAGGVLQITGGTLTTNGGSNTSTSVPTSLIPGGSGTVTTNNDQIPDIFAGFVDGGSGSVLCVNNSGVTNVFAGTLNINGKGNIVAGGTFTTNNGVSGGISSGVITGSITMNAGGTFQLGAGGTLTLSGSSNTPAA